ncbi:MAG: DUF4162 domain-containing protein [Thermoleophilaceae bacterium]
MIAEGTSDELKDRVGGERLEVTLEDVADADAAIETLRALADERPALQDGNVCVPMRRRRGAIVEAVRRLDEARVGVDDIAVRRPTLDDVFISLTGHAAEAAEDEEPAREEAVA